MKINLKVDIDITARKIINTHLIQLMLGDYEFEVDFGDLDYIPSTAIIKNRMDPTGPFLATGTADSEGVYTINTNTNEMLEYLGSSPSRIVIMEFNDEEHGPVAQSNILIKNSYWTQEEDNPIFANKLKHNTTAEDEPSVDDDETENYQVGSIWIYNDTIYVCTDSSEGEAIWVDLLTTPDHNDLTGRTTSNCHPATAISVTHTGVNISPAQQNVESFISAIDNKFSELGTNIIGYAILNSPTQYLTVTLTENMVPGADYSLFGKIKKATGADSTYRLWADDGAGTMDVDINNYSKSGYQLHSGTISTFSSTGPQIGTSNQDRWTTIRGNLSIGADSIVRGVINTERQAHGYTPTLTSWERIVAQTNSIVTKIAVSDGGNNLVAGSYLFIKREVYLAGE